MDDAEGMRIVEALLFVSEEPLTAQKIADILGCERRQATHLARSLAERYESQGHAVSIEEVAGGFQFRTQSDLSPWIKKFLASRPVRLSRASLEVMAVVAYRQPITRHEIESIRGVDCSGVLATLLERKMIKIMGRKDVAGRPIIYGTTQQFLEHFSLSDLSQLPTLKEFAEPPGGHARPDESEGEEGAESDRGEIEPTPAVDAGSAEKEEPNERGDAEEVLTAAGHEAQESTSLSAGNDEYDVKEEDIDEEDET